MERCFLDYVTSLEKRASFPIHILMEEAHRYVKHDDDYEILGYNIFDRITRKDENMDTFGTYYPKT